VLKLFGERVQHCYLPLDVFFATALFLKRLRPKVLVFMETEIWPNLIVQAKNNAIPLQLINGRLSDKSVQQYQKLHWLIAASLKKFDKILTQSEDNKQRFLALGAILENTEVSGNLKYDIQHDDIFRQKAEELQQFLTTDKNIWVMASTHEGDEKIALNTFSAVLKDSPQTLLVIVPRHPERFEEVFTLCVDAGFKVSRRSDKQDLEDDCQIWILDSLGELMGLYSLSDLVTMGGSFSKVGGHNPLEPALFKKPIIVGPNMSNFTEVFDQMLETEGLVQVNSSKELSGKVSTLLNDQNKRATLGQNAYEVIANNQGASAKSLAVLNQLIDK